MGLPHFRSTRGAGRPAERIRHQAGYGGADLAPLLRRSRPKNADDHGRRSGRCLRGEQRVCRIRISLRPLVFGCPQDMSIPVRVGCGAAGLTRKPRGASCSSIHMIDGRGSVGTVLRGGPGRGEYRHAALPSGLPEEPTPAGVLQSDTEAERGRTTNPSASLHSSEATQSPLHQRHPARARKKSSPPKKHPG